jgi:DNA-binding HxlR family transcriptional regulator
LVGISPRTLSLRLRELEREGIVKRTGGSPGSSRRTYALTPKGLDLLPIIADMKAYGERWLVGVGAGSDEDRPLLPA